LARAISARTSSAADRVFLAAGGCRVTFNRQFET
jgi:hypothetical protein